MTHIGYLKPPSVAFLTELRAKDRKSANKWDFINSSIIWVEMGRTDLSVPKNSNGDIQEIECLLLFSEESFKENLEEISMICQYFRDIT